MKKTITLIVYFSVTSTSTVLKVSYTATRNLLFFWITVLSDGMPEVECVAYGRLHLQIRLTSISDKYLNNKYEISYFNYQTHNKFYEDSCGNR
jgi:hypothetical protein